jgi:hypothetical protein
MECVGWCVGALTLLVVLLPSMSRLWKRINEKLDEWANV